MQTINHAVIAIQSVSLTPAPTLSPGVSPPPCTQKPLPSPRGGPGGDLPAGGGTWAEAGSRAGLSGLCTAPNPGWYLCRSLGSIKRGKLFPGLISRPGFNLGARPLVIPPREGAQLSAGKRPVRRDPHPPHPHPTCVCPGSAGWNPHPPLKPEDDEQCQTLVPPSSLMSHATWPWPWPWQWPWPAHCRPQGMLPHSREQQTPLPQPSPEL